MTDADFVDWEWILQQLLVRSGGTCEARTPDCRFPDGNLLGAPRHWVSVQHRRARGMGGTAAPDVHGLANLLLVCGDGVRHCHGWIETRERAQALQRGLWIRHDYLDVGLPVPADRYPLVLASGRTVWLDPVAPVYLSNPGNAGGPG